MVAPGEVGGPEVLALPCPDLASCSSLNSDLRVLTCRQHRRDFYALLQSTAKFVALTCYRLELFEKMVQGLPG